MMGMVEVLEPLVMVAAAVEVVLNPSIMAFLTMAHPAAAVVGDRAAPGLLVIQGLMVIQGLLVQ
tara:strand:+ start:128 stop:319 length:192 start_codon:yes stop_codon:yes gene_type:complete